MQDQQHGLYAIAEAFTAAAAATESGGESETATSLPANVLVLSSVCAGVATLLSLYSIVLQLRNYRKPLVQRWVVRIICMVPIYSLASLIALWSLNAAFLIDLVRDLYEAFCIYCFFSLLITYLGGERSLLILLHGRQPTPHPWPVNRFLQPLDISDPFSFLFLKRGIMQYVQLKPILAVITVILKATGTYAEGQFEANAGYTYVSITYNFSVSLALYCLAMFWVCTNSDLQPFRPMPKFLCVKSLVFATFWQGLVVSILVRTGFLHSSRYGDENFSIALQDSILCFEMPLFALLHLYAFSHRDYLPSETRTFSGRLPFRYAVRDSLLGYKDVLDDSLTTFRGTGFSYRTFEPAEGGLHSNVGDARARRARAGLRYANGGKTKYWLPMPGADVEEAYGRHSAGHAPLGAGGYAGKDTRHRIAEAAGDSQVAAQEVRHGIAEMIVNPIQTLGRKIRERRDADRGYAPIAPEQADEVVHQDPRYVIDRVASRHAEERETTSGLVPFGLNGNGEGGQTLIGRTGESASESSSVRDARLEFGEPDEDEERLYADARQHEFGDYNYPIVDASKEEARRKMRDLEDAFIAGRSRRPDWRTLDPAGMAKRRQSGPQQGKSSGSGKAKGRTVPGRTRNKALQGAVVDLRKGVVDLLVEDKQAEQEEQILERGEPSLRAGGPRKLFRRTYGTLDNSDAQPTAVPFARFTAKLPETPPIESDTAHREPGTALIGKQGPTVQLEEENSTAVQAPDFARLTHLQDGQPFEQVHDLHDEGHGENMGEADKVAEGSPPGAGAPIQRSNRDSTGPDFNPWD